MFFLHRSIDRFEAIFVGIFQKGTFGRALLEGCTWQGIFGTYVCVFPTQECGLFSGHFRGLFLEGHFW